MDIKNIIASTFSVFKKTKNNSNTGLVTDPNTFLKYGKKMPSSWTIPQITDEDFYTGYGFAVINKRANRSVVIGKKFLHTEANQPVMDEANKKGERIVHPYLDLIRNSTDFSERDFWYNISTYLDLEGVYYLMAVRAKGATMSSRVQKFVLLNPYWIRQVTNSKGEVGGYVESNPYKGHREIPAEMIIPITLLNPFDETKSYSLADAARDSQFTLKQANDFARESIEGNLNAPGILGSSILLSDDQFDNFVDRIKSHQRGEPLFGNGAGTIHWTDMQSDLDKAALDKINSINRDVLLAVSGLSKTGVGVEESGTGREVSRTQKDDFTENAIMPQIENIIDALNLDYRRTYADDYAKNGYSIGLKNPLETNKDAEQADVDIRSSQFTLMQEMLDKGYSHDVASKYAKGEISVLDLGEPAERDTAPDKEEPKDDPKEGEQEREKDDKGSDDSGTGTEADKSKKDNSSDGHGHTHPHSCNHEHSEYQLYEGYPIPVLQYLGSDSKHFKPATEGGSAIYSKQAIKKITLNNFEIRGRRLIASTEGAFVVIGSFTDAADRDTIVKKLEKQYKNQLLAVKKKHECPEPIKVDNAAFDKQETIGASAQQLRASVEATEDEMFDWYLDEVEKGVNSPHADPDNYIDGLAMPFAVYFTVMLPIYAAYRMRETSKELGLEEDIPALAITSTIKATIDDFARKDATSHVNTLKTDLENALTIIKAKTSDPQQIKDEFVAAFARIKERRASLIANNASSRIFNLSQYHADLQLLNRNGLTKRAYKVMFSRTGKPCPFCAALIAETQASPIPFTQDFASMGDMIEAGDKSFAVDYENIIAGNVHPNCNCSYKIIMEDDK